ncbi:MAG: hypothetical protein EPN39_18665 [Chitinophagaceae bacterium]|nr:MAG: hypothetical protein EPN39_18665 [Chitinophagaceae bacterium]
MTLPFKHLFRGGLMLFCFIFLFNQKSNCQSLNYSNPEYKKIVAYLHNGCQVVLPQLRKDSQIVMIIAKYYINPRGATDSVVLSDNTSGKLEKYLKSMNRKLINWNKLLPPSSRERIAAVPFYVGPEKNKAEDFTFANFPSTLSITHLFSFSQNPSINFKERLYLMPVIINIYITGNIDGM